jgi:O-antigen ligase
LGRLTVRDRQTLDSGRGTNSSVPQPTMQQGSSPSAPQLEARVSWLGVPRFNWSLTLLGLCIFTFSIVTFYLPIALVGIAVAAVGLVLQHRKVRVPLPVWLYGAYVLWAFLASLVSPYADFAIDKVLDSLKLLAIMFIVVNALQTEGQLRFYLLFFLGCFILFPVRGTLKGGDEVFGRAVWWYIYDNPNDLAALCIFALGIALGFMFSSPSRTHVRLGAGISAILLLVVILSTQSRGAFIGLVAGMGPALILLAVKRPGRVLFSAGVLALIIALAVPAAVWERLSGIMMLTSTSTIALADPEGSAEQRFAIQKVALQIVVDNPVFGVGLGAYPLENAKYAPALGRRDTHNTYLNVAAEVGLPGFALWCALVWSVLRFAYRSRRLVAPEGLATQQAWLERALWGYLVAGMFGTYAALTFPYLMLGVLWCSATLLTSQSPLPGSTPRTMKA